MSDTRLTENLVINYQPASLLVNVVRPQDDRGHYLHTRYACQLFQMCPYSLIVCSTVPKMPEQLCERISLSMQTVAIRQTATEPGTAVCNF
jgi:hypothetical protein